MGGDMEVIARGVCAVGGMVLFCRTKGAENTYLPGGHVEFGESAPNSLVREMREELGLECSTGAFLGIIEHAFFQSGERHCEVNLVFELKSAHLDPAGVPRAVEEHIEFLWMPLARLVDSDLEPAPLRRLIPEWLSGRGNVERWASTL